MTYNNQENQLEHQVIKYFADEEGGGEDDVNGSIFGQDEVVHWGGFEELRESLKK